LGRTYHYNRRMCRGISTNSVTLKFKSFWLRDAPELTFKYFTFCHTVFMCLSQNKERLVPLTP